MTVLLAQARAEVRELREENRRLASDVRHLGEQLAAQMTAAQVMRANVAELARQAGVLLESQPEPEARVAPRCNCGMSQPVVSEPECAAHALVQHRDGKPPWCRTCGRDARGVRIGNPYKVAFE